MLAVTALAWAGVVIFAWLILGMHDQRKQEQGSREQEVAQQTTAARTRALAQETAADRAALDAFTKVEVLSAVNLIESAGLPFGVHLHVRDAQPGSSAVKLPEGSLSTVGFIIEADGSFSALMRAAQILESLPIPTSIEQLDLGGVLGKKEATNDSWHLNARVRFFTSSNISS